MRVVIISLIATLALSGHGAQAVDDMSPQAAPRIGAPRSAPLIRRDMHGVASPALNKRYALLSEQEKRAAREEYDGMMPGDEPPFALHGLGHIRQLLLLVKDNAAEQGRLSMVVKVNSRGEVSAIEVLRSPSKLVTTIAARALMAEKFKPGICRGVPCAMEFAYRVNLSGEH